MKIKIWGGNGMGLGIALSGGGLRGVAHIGILKALEEHDIYPQFISGASAGSIIAGMYAAGVPIKEMEEMSEKLGNYLLDPDIFGIISTLLRISFGKPIVLDGLLKGNSLDSFFRSIIGDVKIKDARIPLAISSVDINTSKTIMFVSHKGFLADDENNIYIDDCSICDAIRASIAIPVIFKPKMLRNMRLVDGGVRDNIPVDILLRMGARSVIAVNLGYCGQTRRDIDNIIEIGSQTIDIMAYQITKLKTTNAAIMVNPHIYDVNLFDFHKVKECIQRGYEVTINNIDSIKRAINRI